MQEKFYKNLPQSPGVYLMKDVKGRLLYVGKAVNLRRRVASYFMRAQDGRIERLVSKIKKIDFKKTDSALEALILEARLIKKNKPPFNVREKDDKSFLYIEITNEEFPRVLLVRGHDVQNIGVDTVCRYGPFTSAANVREALRILRRIFPWSTHPSIALKTSVTRARLYPERSRRACLDYEIGLCPGTCVGVVSRIDYLKNIKKLQMFLSGKKKRLYSVIEQEMREASKKMEFEKAEKLRRQLFALKHIRDTALVTDEKSEIPASPAGRRDPKSEEPAARIEGYDISNISGAYAVGSMVVFSDGKPDKGEYRKFRIKTIRRSDDVGMMKEVLRRRFNNNWPLPNLILIDGGRGQVNAARTVLNEADVKITVVGIAKGPERKKNEFIGRVPEWTEKKVLIRVRDEAHRFAIAYHRKLRNIIR